MDFHSSEKRKLKVESTHLEIKVAQVAVEVDVLADDGRLGQIALQTAPHHRRENHRGGELEGEAAAKGTRRRPRITGMEEYRLIDNLEDES